MPFLLRASCLLALLGLWSRSGLGQRVTIDSIRLAHTGGLGLPAAGRAIVFAVEPKGTSTQFRQYVFRNNLSQQQRRELQLPGRLELVNTAISRHHLLYQLHRRGANDSLLTLVVDTLGRVIKLRRERGTGVQWREMSGSLAPQAQGFLLGEPYRRTGEMMVRFLDSQLTQRWRHRFTSPVGQLSVEDAILDSTHVWLLVTSNARSRRATTKAYCMELATGKVLCRLPLDYQGERRVPGVGSMGPGHSLLLAGYSYANNRPSRVKTGRLFTTRLHPDSTRSHDRLVSLPAGTLLGAQGRKIRWGALRPEAGGSLRLVGETYTSTSLGGNIAMGVATRILTLGLLQVSTTTLSPRDLLSLRITPAGQVDEVRVLPLPEGGSLTVHGYLQARQMAQLAAQAGTFRLRGFTPDSQRVVLRTERRILTMDLHSGRVVPLRQAMPGGHTDVWTITPQGLLLYNELRGPQRLDLERVAY